MPVETLNTRIHGFFMPWIVLSEGPIRCHRLRQELDAGKVPLFRNLARIESLRILTELFTQFLRLC